MRLLVAIVLGLVALPVSAAGPLDALRAGSRSAAERLKVVKADQLSKRNELSVLSSRIEALKTSSRGKLLPGGELDTALKASQELSSGLTDLAQQATARETELEAANLALLEALSGELVRLRAEFDRQTDRPIRRGLIEAMKKTRAEREALRSVLPATTAPNLGALKPTDDPEELLEQADLLRDGEEKLARDLKALDGRIAERRDEVELDRRVQRFMGEESMFDDQDRRLRVQRSTERSLSFPGAAPASADFSNGRSSVQDVAGSFPGYGNTPGVGGPSAQAGPAAPQGAAQGTGSTEFNTPGPTDSKSTVTRVTNGSDARPQVGSSKNGLAGADADLNELEAQRAKVKALVDELRKKAAELERRAAQLK